MPLPRQKWQAELQEIERQLVSNPGSVDLQFRRALFSFELGRVVEARNDYMKVLAREPRHLGALNALGNLLSAAGQYRAARIAYGRAVASHPNDAMSRVNLGNLILQQIENLEIHEKISEALPLRQEARVHYEQALRLKPDYERAHEGLSYLLAELGDEPKAAWHRREAFRKRYIIPLPYRGSQAPLPVLLLASTAGGNVKLQRFLDDNIFQTIIVLPEFYDPKIPLPPHQLVVNAIGEAELTPGALDASRSVLAMTTAPVVNPPGAVLATTRSNNAKRFSGLPGVVAPLTATLPRGQLSAPGAAATLARRGFEFPLLLRTPGSHTGMNFLPVENLEALATALAQLPGQELTVLQFLDARGPDGKTRKYRVMTIDGQLYPLHLAISDHWKVHYFTADMAGKPEHRAEEAAFLEDMPRVLGGLAMNALEEIQSVLGLDYGGIDFGLNAKGEVLVFEANATMAVNPPGRQEQWSYRLPAYERIHAAVQKMLMAKALAAEPLRSHPMVPLITAPGSSLSQ
jgi:tetratricopeptide (TPR) repeat protein